jgi:hypothetical protein
LNPMGAGNWTAGLAKGAKRLTWLQLRGIGAIILA